MEKLTLAFLLLVILMFFVPIIYKEKFYDYALPVAVSNALGTNNAYINQLTTYGTNTIPLADFTTSDFKAIQTLLTPLIGNPNLPANLDTFIKSSSPSPAPAPAPAPASYDDPYSYAPAPAPAPGSAVNPLLILLNDAAKATWIDVHTNNAYSSIALFYEQQLQLSQNPNLMTNSDLPSISFSDRYRNLQGSTLLKGQQATCDSYIKFMEAKLEAGGLPIMCGEPQQSCTQQQQLVEATIAASWTTAAANPGPSYSPGPDGKCQDKITPCFSGNNGSECVGGNKYGSCTLNDGSKDNSNAGYVGDGKIGGDTDTYPAGGDDSTGKLDLNVLTNLTNSLNANYSPDGTFIPKDASEFTSGSYQYNPITGAWVFGTPNSNNPLQFTVPFYDKKTGKYISPSVVQGKDYMSKQLTMNPADYIRKDSIPCYGCSFPSRTGNSM